MRLTTALLMGIASMMTGCAREQEKIEPALERAQEELEAAMEEAETRLDEGTAEAKKALAAAMKHWDELRPEAEKAVASLEDRFQELVEDEEALKRLPPQTLERIRERLDALRAKLAEAKAAHEQGNTDLAVEKADDVQQESAAIEELLVEKPDPPAHDPAVR